MPNIRHKRLSNPHYKAQDARRNWYKAHVSGIRPNVTVLCPIKGPVGFLMPIKRPRMDVITDVNSVETIFYQIYDQFYRSGLFVPGIRPSRVILYLV